MALLKRKTLLKELAKVEGELFRYTAEAVTAKL